MINIDWFKDLEVEKKIDRSKYPHAEMGDDQLAWIWQIIQKTRPENLVEIGVASGGTTSMLLDAIATITNAKLYSFDYNFNYYRESDKKTGFIAEEHCKKHNYQNWQLFTGGMSCRHLDKLALNSIDFCLIDTMHRNPGEHLDILQILPFLKENAIVILHDIALHIRIEVCWTTHIVLNSLHGTLIPKKSPYLFSESAKKELELIDLMPNIGGIILDSNIESMLPKLFNNLALPWTYKIPQNDYEDLLKHFNKHYNQDYANFFALCYKLQMQRLMNK